MGIKIIKIKKKRFFTNLFKIQNGFSKKQLSFIKYTIKQHDFHLSTFI